MPINLDLDPEFVALLRKEEQSHTSAELPTATVEVVVNPNDRGLGFARIHVQGFSGEEGKKLRGQWDAKRQAYLKVQNWIEKRTREINPEGEKDALGEEYAKEAAKGEAKKWEDLAIDAWIAVCREVCRLGVTGFDEGELAIRGVLQPCLTEVVGGRTVLAAETLDLIGLFGLTLGLSRAILTVSRRETPPTAEEQWAEAAKQKEEAGKTERPFVEASTP